MREVITKRDLVKEMRAGVTGVGTIHNRPLTVKETINYWVHRRAYAGQYKGSPDEGYRKLGLEVWAPVQDTTDLIDSAIRHNTRW